MSLTATRHPDPDAHADGDPPPDDRRAQLLFLIVVLVGLAVILWFGRHTWFKGDEWNVLVTREVTDLGDLFRPINRVHWITLPIVLYRGVYTVFGLHSYLPYQLPVVLLHLSVAVLLRRVMIRAAVNPWIATAAATAFVFFGSGRPNLVWGFQVTLVGSLAFGLVHLLLATHDGPIDRRDGYGLAAGFAGLLCSGLAPTMTIVVGLAVLMLRGWRRAALHTVPLGLIYLLWWFGYAQSRAATEADRGTPAQWIEFLWLGLKESFTALGQFTGVGAALVAILVVGLGLAWRSDDRTTTREHLALPLAMLIGAVIFLYITALGRTAAGLGEGGLVVLGPESAKSPRFLHVAVALLLPALAVAASALATRWRWTLIPLGGLFLIGVPGNIDELANPRQVLFSEQVHQSDRDFARAAPRLDLAAEIPDDTLAHPRSIYVTMGWLRGAESDGRLPGMATIPERVELTLSAFLSLESSTVAPSACGPAEPGELITLQAGDALTFDSAPDVAMALVYVSRDGQDADPRRFIQLVSPTVVATTGPTSVRVEPDDRIDQLRVCRATPS